MPNRAAPELLAGVIEGFYGQPWTQAERFELFDWMAAWGLNTYLYAPKDDLKHRALWREIYTAEEAKTLGAIIAACRQRSLRFIYAIGPGLDIGYSQQADRDFLKKRFEQMLSLSCGDFALLFDDIPGSMEAADIARWGSLASAQCHVANELFHWTREHHAPARFFFCPTPYCGRMANQHHGGEGYLSCIGRELAPEIDVFWTGPDIISEEIRVAPIQELETLLRRKPVIWDNLHANDYDGRRFYCGPYSGRPIDLKDHVKGLLCNPNNEFPLNYVPLRTLAQYVAAKDPWNPRQAYLSAMGEWSAQFAVIGAPLALDDLILFGDCFYLPHKEGPLAESLYQLTRDLLAEDPAHWGNQAASFQQQSARLRVVCGRLAELRHRPLFYALSRRVWELREELDLLEHYVAFHSASARADAQFHSDFHLPGTYRGGFSQRLQQLLKLRPDGSILPARDVEDSAAIEPNPSTSLSTL